MKRPALVVFPALALVFSVGCADAATHGVQSTSSGTNAPSTTVARTSQPTKGSIGGTALSLLGTIRVSRENPTGYQRTKFRHWVDSDGDGCNTREEVLVDESLGKAQVMWPGCKVVAGDWVSRYDGVAVTDPAELDIDHFVPLKEAWDSGAFAWSAAQREQYANDLSDPRALVAVTASTNRSKGEKDPPQWMPPAGSDFCTYLSDWVVVKAHWRLTMDESEYRFIEKRLKGQCAGTTALTWGTATNDSPSAAVPADTAPSNTDAGQSSADTTVKGALPTIHPGAWCSPKGALGTRNGKSYVCSTTSATGRPYADNRAHWRPA